MIKFTLYCNCFIFHIIQSQDLLDFFNSIIVFTCLEPGELLLIEYSLDTDLQMKKIKFLSGCLISSDSESFYHRLTISSPTFTFPYLLLNSSILGGRVWCCCWGSLPSELEPLPRASADAAAPTHGRHLSSCWLDTRRQMLTVRCVGMAVQAYISMLDMERQA